jgi:hypothetical protein
LYIRNYTEGYNTSTLDTIIQGICHYEEVLQRERDIVEPEVRKKIFAYLKQMQLVKGKNISPKGPKRKAVKA